MARVQRRLPRIEELRPLVRVERPTLQRTRRALERANTIEDLRHLARRRTPNSAFDYVDGAAESEVSLTRAREAFGRVEFRPRVLRDVSQIQTAVSILDVTSPIPLILAPTGFTRMMQHEGERAVGRAAAAAGIPYTLSTMGTVSVEDLATDVPDVQRWFQLYLWQDREASLALMGRARDAGYSTLVLTVDTCVGGERLRDVRNGMTIPPQLTPRTLTDMALHPRWWANLLTTAPLEFASLRGTGGTVEQLINRMFDPTLNTRDLVWLRDNWPGAIVLKGIQNVEDAKEFVDLGVDGLIVSNHGGRQLDRSVTPLEVLPGIAAAVGGRVPVLLDTGVMHGGDIVAAVANGADAVMVGRAYLYGLMAGGEAGVARALDILTTQFQRTMRLLGVTSLDQLTPDRAVLHPAGPPAPAHYA
ncbi:alpha-hydroxy acid oxidase [Ornithinimicrobium cavernae]|uniref:alpha-hydroxy acid oxidase n=1 Tax=Ornithinimicrobium cavernae TaxID=2666047 RepID=UPI000D68C467|nr:alpha-hydroxy acid oxidase [Ornithinimicrobium cavernae]